MCKVEIFDYECGDSIYIPFDSYKEAVAHVRKIGRKMLHHYIFILMEECDGKYTYTKRQDWTGGRHDVCMDVIVA